MIKFAALLAVSIALAAIWLITGITMQISPRSYLDLTAPWWHVALHIVWFLTGLVTSMTGVAMLYERWSRRKKLAGQPPQNA
jgi:hypothetical protein